MSRKSIFEAMSWMRLISQLNNRKERKFSSRVVLAAERHKSVATAEGRGRDVSQQMSRGAAKESASAPRLVQLRIQSTASSRGYNLMPLRGWELLYLHNGHDHQSVATNFPIRSNAASILAREFAKESRK